MPTLVRVGTWNLRLLVSRWNGICRKSLFQGAIEVDAVVVDHGVEIIGLHLELAAFISTMQVVVGTLDIPIVKDRAYRRRSGLVEDGTEAEFCATGIISQQHALCIFAKCRDGDGLVGIVEADTIDGDDFISAPEDVTEMLIETSVDGTSGQFDGSDEFSEGPMLEDAGFAAVDHHHVGGSVAVAVVAGTMTAETEGIAVQVEVFHRDGIFQVLLAVAVRSISQPPDTGGSLAVVLKVEQNPVFVLVSENGGVVEQHVDELRILQDSRSGIVGGEIQAKALKELDLISCPVGLVFQPSGNILPVGIDVEVLVDVGVVGGVEVGDVVAHLTIDHIGTGKGDEIGGSGGQSGNCMSSGLDQSG